MKIYFLVATLLLVGCQTIAPADPPKWPDVPKELLEKCPNLKQADLDKPQMTEFLKTVVHNYELYYLCSIKQENWSDWYKKHKENHEKVFKK